VIEATLSGALLMEQANPETERWLTRDVHYASFVTEAELVEKVRYYLAHEEERAALAAAGAAHAERTLSAAAYWRRVLEAVLPEPVPA
jgi:spore maturation protein CgeB